ncbi:MAG: DEAD/DEAH box helicase [Spirochaetaceae bacterium]|jgi:superfamily II DNA/RNA helicase|nr:DEAD/DEAH box helicase [Spirochaetaceae bacterium]
MNFSALRVAPHFLKILSRRGITKPTEIQRLVIPRLLAGENLLFQAPTGTGKTFAYLLPLFQRLFADPAGIQGKVRLLICAPTLELCSQIKGEVDFLLSERPADGVDAAATALAATASAAVATGTAPRAALLIGSADIKRQIEMLKKEKPAVVVGNSARLLQLARMGRLRLDGVRAVVLDEGDRLAANELREETEALLRFVPTGDRQTTACSATLSAKSRERLSSLFGPSIAVGSAITSDSAITSGSVPAVAFIQAEEKITSIEHWAFFAENRKKISCLRSLLAAAKPKKALVFTARGADAGNILSQLQYHHFAAGGIWGDMEKRVRKAAMDGFRQGNLSVLVASDLACRGLDIAGISHVIALDVPDDPELYLHRSGRTGRTGKRGIMASIGNEEELRRLQKIEKKLGITVYPKELYGGRVLAPEA